MNDFCPVQQTAVSGTGAVNIVPASGATMYCDLCALIVTTTNAVAGTLTVSDGNRTVFVLDYPNNAAKPAASLVITPANPIEQSGAGNTAWTITASVNASGYNVTAQYRVR
jgi:hypothetical protein